VIKDDGGEVVDGLRRGDGGTAELEYFHGARSCACVCVS
jgi:hypothetical protein